MPTMLQLPESVSAGFLSVAVLSPSEQRRNAAIAALTEHPNCEVRKLPSYPRSLGDVPQMLKEQFDAVLIDLDPDPEYALDLVENISARGSAIVMVYSAKVDPEMVMRCMRAGAREFLTQPFNRGTIAEALGRAASRRPEALSQKKTDGGLHVFAGAKGGSGVTTLACNFAVSLAKETGQRTVLIDLNLPLGDAAINLGISPEFTTVDAFQNAARLDANFLCSLVARHSSALFVLAAPDQLAPTHSTHEAIDRLITVAREAFDYVVVDAGRKLDLWSTTLYDPSATFYLVTQVGVPELRNANRLISQFSRCGSPKLEIVLNRYQANSLELAEQHITKALTKPARWKIPNSYATVLRMQKTAIPFAMEDSSISRIVHEMARSVNNQPALPETKKKLGFFQRGAPPSAGGRSLTILSGGM